MLAIAGALIALAVKLNLGIIALLPPMILTGGALAAQYTAGAVGSTHTDAGRYGAGVGFFNLLRVGGSAAGPAIVATVLQHDAAAYAAVFGISALAALAALAGTIAAQARQSIGNPT